MTEAEMMDIKTDGSETHEELIEYFKKLDLILQDDIINRVSGFSGSMDLLSELCNIRTMKIRGI